MAICELGLASGCLGDNSSQGMEKEPKETSCTRAEQARLQELPWGKPPGQDKNQALNFL